MVDRNPLYNRNRSRSSKDEGFRNDAQDQTFSSRRSGGRAAQRANSHIPGRKNDRIAEHASSCAYGAAERANGRACNHVADRNERYSRDRALRSSRQDNRSSSVGRSNRSNRAGRSDRVGRENRTKLLDQTPRRSRRGNDYQNQPRFASSTDTKQRRRSSASARESYGHARDYAQEGSYTQEGRYIPDEQEHPGYDKRGQERGYERRQGRFQQEYRRSYRSSQAHNDYYDEYENTSSEEST